MKFPTLRRWLCSRVCESVYLRIPTHTIPHRNTSRHECALEQLAALLERNIQLSHSFHGSSVALVNESNAWNNSFCGGLTPRVLTRGSASWVCKWYTKTLWGLRPHQPSFLRQPVWFWDHCSIVNYFLPVRVKHPYLMYHLKNITVTLSESATSYSLQCFERRWSL